VLDAHDDAYVILEGQSVVADKGTGVLVNDQSLSSSGFLAINGVWLNQLLVSGATDPSLSAVLLVGPANGSVNLAADGSFTYVPNSGFSGIDSFTYVAQTTGGDTDEAEATIYVVPMEGGSPPTIDLFALTPQEQVASIYVAFFDRGADLAGFNFWVNQFITNLPIQGAKAVFANIASSFAVSDEAKAVYPLLANPPTTEIGSPTTNALIGEFIKIVYANLFNRIPDGPGLDYWTEQVNNALANGQGIGNVLVDIINGAQNSSAGQDVTTLMSKVAVSLEYVEEQAAFGTPWSMAENRAEAVALLEPVTSDPLSTLAGTAHAESLVQPPSSFGAASATLTSENVMSSGLAFIHDDESGALGVTSVVQPGDDIQRLFDMGQGDQLDLTQILAGAALQADLTNISDFVKVVGYGANDAGIGAGSKTMLEIVGPNGSASVTLEGSGSLTVNDLVRNNSLVLPPH